MPQNWSGLFSGLLALREFFALVEGKSIEHCIMKSTILYEFVVYIYIEISGDIGPIFQLAMNIVQHDLLPSK